MAFAAGGPCVLQRQQAQVQRSQAVAGAPSNRLAARCRAACSPRAPLRVAARSGGNVLDRPAPGGGAGDGYDVSKRAGWDDDRSSTLTLPRPEAGQGGGDADRQKGSMPGGGNHRLLLLDSTSHTAKKVVAGLTSVVPQVDENKALNCFETSKQLGMAIVTSCLKEHAEHFQMALYRLGVKTAIEPDTTTA